MDMDASVWSELPFEMVEHVLSFLLWPDVCRNRSVCKKWNQLILSDQFAALHGQHARRRRGPSFIVINMRRPTDTGEDREVWCCLDLSARRWYTFDEDEWKIDPFDSGVQSMDGGLVCRFLRANPQHLSIVVHNVKGLAYVTLPQIERHLNSPDHPKLLMVAESTSFKIFLINHNFDTVIDDEFLDDPRFTSEERLKIKYDPLMHVYDSATCEWRSIINTSWTELGGLGKIRSIVLYQGFLYVLFRRKESPDVAVWRLLSYNLTVESWENVHVCTDSFLASSLVVSNDCLFMVLWFWEECSDDDMSEEWFFQVQDLMTQETVLKLSEADVMTSFDIKTGSPTGIRPFIGRFDLLGISVIGFESSLFLMSQLSGKSKLFDLVTRSWDHGLPSNPLTEVHVDDEGHTAWIEKHMNLLLPWNRGSQLQGY